MGPPLLTRALFAAPNRPLTLAFPPRTDTKTIHGAGYNLEGAGPNNETGLCTADKGTWNGAVGYADGGGQAQIHRGYWTPLRQSVDEEVEELVVDVDAHLSASAESLGL